jgi:hypothetical protein
MNRSGNCVCSQKVNDEMWTRFFVLCDYDFLNLDGLFFGEVGGWMVVV